MPPETSWIGQEIRTFKILSLLGKGGMGEVYRARDTRLGRDVAIKVLAAPFTKDPARRGRFEQEARALAALNHPNIGAIYGLEEAGEACALILELVEGETLDTFQKRPMDFDLAVRLARQICLAIEAAHGKEIVHRDLKPANIKITPDGTLKVLDFGLAKAFLGDQIQGSQAPTATSDGAVVGTPAYMSPEQARGQPLDKRTDIWAFGCILYELLSGRQAFSGATASDTIAAVLRAEPDWNALPASTPFLVQRLLRRCLEKDPDRRLHDIADARIELDDIGAFPMPAAVAAAPSRRWSYTAWIAALLALLILVAVMLRPAPGPTAVRLSRALRVTSTAAREFGPAISPDGKWVAYYSNARGPADVWVKFLDSGATSNLTASLNYELPVRAGIGGLAISPDGSTIAFIARPDLKLTTFDTWIIPAPIGGVPRKLLQNLQSMQWSPDGKQITAIRPGSSRGDALVIANSDGTNQRDLISPQGGRHIHWQAWDFAGNYIYFIYTYDTWHTEPSEIFRVSAAGGTPEPVARSFRRAVYPIPLPGGDLAYSGNPDSIDLGLWWRSAEGGDPRPLTTGVGEHVEGRLSADGKKLVTTLQDLKQSLVSFPISNPAQMRAISDGHGGDLDPVYDPRGNRIVFSSSRLGHRNLWIARPDGSEARPLTTEAAIDQRPAFSPDGQQVAFVSDRGGKRGIWIMSPEGGAPVLVGTTEVLDNTLTWSADGKRILFSLPADDLPRLATISIPDGKIETSKTVGVAPAWSPVANVIAYLQPTEIPAQTPSTPIRSVLWLKFIDAEGRQLFPDFPQQTFPNGFLAWAPDGRRLAAVSVSASAASSIWIAEPGSREPLKKLVDLPPSFQRLRGITWSPDGASVLVGWQEADSDIILFDVNR